MQQQQFKTLNNSLTKQSIVSDLTNVVKHNSSVVVINNDDCIVVIFENKLRRYEMKMFDYSNQTNMRWIDIVINNNNLWIRRDEFHDLINTYAPLGNILKTAMDDTDQEIIHCYILVVNFKFVHLCINRHSKHLSAITYMSPYIQYEHTKLDMININYTGTNLYAFAVDESEFLNDKIYQFVLDKSKCKFQIIMKVELESYHNFDKLLTTTTNILSIIASIECNRQLVNCVMEFDVKHTQWLPKFKIPPRITAEHSIIININEEKYQFCRILGGYLLIINVWTGMMYRLNMKNKNIVNTGFTIPMTQTDSLAINIIRNESNEKLIICGYERQFMKMTNKSHLSSQYILSLINSYYCNDKMHILLNGRISWIICVDKIFK